MPTIRLLAEIRVKQKEIDRLKHREKMITDAMTDTCCNCEHNNSVEEFFCDVGSCWVYQLWKELGRSSR